jgi:hypothetical protein
VADAIVGALRAILGLDTASYEEGAKRAGKSTQNLGDLIKGVFGGATLARVVERTFDAIAHSFKSAIIQGFQFADEMGKMAQKVGISVEELSSLKVAADLSDVSMEALSAGLGKLSKNIVAAAQGTGEARQQFDALGISVRDSAGALKSPIAVLIELADKFKDSADGSVKVAASLALLGKGGKELIPLLNEGGQSLRDFAKLAKDMGLIIETDTARKVQDFNDNLKIVSFSMQGIANLVVKDLIDGFLRVSQSFVKTAKDGETIREMAKQISNAIKEVIVTIVILAEANELLGKASFDLTKDMQALGAEHRALIDKALEPMIQKFTSVIDKINEYGLALGRLLGTLGEGAGAIEEVGEEFDETGPKAEKAATGFGRITEAIKVLMGRAGLARGLIDKMFEPLPAAAEKAGRSIDIPNKNIDTFNEKIKALRMQTLEASNVFAGQLAPGFLTAASGIKALDGQITIIRDRLVVLGPLAQKFNEEMLKLAGVKLSAEFLAPWDLFALKLQEINLLHERGAISADIRGRAELKVAAESAQAYGEYASMIVGPLASAFKTAASMNKKYAGIAKVAAIGEATVATYLAATKALATTAPWPLPLAFAAAAVAAGLANVAKISAQEFATGGSFKVGGGMGGIDNQLITFKATPGEMVDVRKPGKEGPAGVQEITLRGLSGRDLFTGDMLRDLFDGLNRGMADGYKLKVAT